MHTGTHTPLRTNTFTLSKFYTSHNFLQVIDKIDISINTITVITNACMHVCCCFLLFCIIILPHVVCVLVTSTLDRSHGQLFKPPCNWCLLIELIHYKPGRGLWTMLTWFNIYLYHNNYYPFLKRFIYITSLWLNLSSAVKLIVVEYELSLHLFKTTTIISSVCSLLETSWFHCLQSSSLFTVLTMLEASFSLMQAVYMYNLMYTVLSCTVCHQAFQLRHISVSHRTFYCRPPCVIVSVVFAVNHYYAL